MKLALLFIILIISIYGNDTYSDAKKAEKKKDYVLAEKLYKEACDSGNDEACLGLTNLYFNGKGEHGDMIVTYKLSKMLCKKNNAEGCFFLGYFYSEGKGIQKNIAEGKLMLNKACDLGEYKACMNLAITYQKSENYIEALSLYEKAYQYGHNPAGTPLGNIYMHGLGVDKNPERAIEYFRESCEKGKVTTSCAALGAYYLENKRYDLARKYLEITCNMKPDIYKDSKEFIATSCTNFALLYAKGLGGDRSPYGARKYLKKACDMSFDLACKYYNMSFGGQ